MSGANPPSSPTPVESPLDLRIPLSVWKTSTPARRASAKVAKPDGAHHEFLRVEAIVGVGAAVDDVHHRDRKRARAGAAEIPVERQARGRRGRPRHGEGDAEDGVGAESPLVLGAVELDQDPVEQGLVPRVGAQDLAGDLAVDVRDGLRDALSAVALLVAVAQLQRLALAGRGARRHRRAPGRASREQDLDLDGRIAARVQDLPAEDGLDGKAHGFNNSFAARARAAASSCDFASAYTRATGSVPDSRTRIHEPSSKSNFIPSSWLTEATLRPAKRSGGEARRAFRACFSSGEAGRSRRVEKNGPICPRSSSESSSSVLPGGAGHLRDEEVGQDAVLLRHVSLDRQARALLRAEDDLAGDQLLADVLEADRRLVEGNAEARGDRVERVRGRDAPGDAAAAPLAREQVPEEQREDLVGLDVDAARVADAETVRVSVAGEAQARAPARGRLRPGARAPSRRTAATRRRRAGRPSRSSARDPRSRPRGRRRGTPRRSRSGNRARSGAFRARRPPAAPWRQGRRGTPAPDRSVATGREGGSATSVERGDSVLHLLRDLRERRSPVGGGELDAEILGRIVAGGEVDRARGAAPADLEREDRRRDRARGHLRLEPLGFEQARGLGGETAGQEARVVADENEAALLPFFREHARHRRDDPARRCRT